MRHDKQDAEITNTAILDWLVLLGTFSNIDLVPPQGVQHERNQAKFETKVGALLN
jgi:hypothetical protein